MPSLMFRDYLARLGTTRTYPVGLLTVTLPSAPLDPLRLASTRDRNVLSRGLQFFRSGLDFTLPSRLDEGEQRTRLTLPAVDLTILQTLRAAPNRLALTLELVMSADPDTVELGPYRLIDLARTYSATTQSLSLECAYRDVLSHPRPRYRYTPANVPGMFGRANLEGVDA